MSQIHSSQKDKRSNNCVKKETFTMGDEAPLLMSVTQSKSFGSPSIPPTDFDSSDLQLALSKSSDSMGFDLKASFDDYGMMAKDEDQHRGETTKQAHDSNASVASSGTKDTESTSVATQDHVPARPAYHYPHGYGHPPPPPPYGRPPYPPQFQHATYYPGHYGAPPSHHPHHHAHTHHPHTHHPHHPSYPVPPTHYHQYGNGYVHHSGYANTSSFVHNHSHSSHNSEQSSILNSRYAKSSSSSVSSSTSLGSKKRTIDEVNGNKGDDHGPAGDFSNHRGSSNNSVCSSGTSNTAPNNISKLVSESPVKKDPEESSLVHSLERTNSMDSAGSSLTFGALSMNSQAKKRAVVQKESLIPSPISEQFVNDGVTPVSKNTKLSNRKGFFLECDTGGDFAMNGFTPLPNIASSISKSSDDRKDSISPDFSLTIKPQLSWNIAEDNQGETPVSLGSNIGANFWGDDGKSPSAHMLAGMSSPASLSEGFLGGASSPISVFFEGGSSANNRKGFNSTSKDKSSLDCTDDDHDMTPLPSTMMPLQSPFFNGPHTPYSSMSVMNESRDDALSSMDHHNHGRRDGQPDYLSPKPMYHHSDRVVNLRGQRPHGVVHNMHLPPHIPSHHHFLTSPIGAPGPGSRHMMSMAPPHHMTSPYSVSQANSQMALSKNRCIPLKQPIPNKFQGDMEKYKDAAIPEFTALVNYPSHMSQKQTASLPEGMRCCVMCGQACRCSMSKSTKKGGKKDDLNSKNPNGSYAMIPTQNKGLCTSCDVNVWIVLGSNLEIKWCKGCKNFRPWAAFGEKGLATKCVRCRDRQREKYAAQKEDKDKKKPAKK